MSNSESVSSTRRVSRQREAGEVTRRETRRRLLAAAKQEFAERGYAAATVVRIADRADVSVQTLYSAWGNKRALLRAVMETSVMGDDDTFFEAERPPVALLFANVDDAVLADPHRLINHIVHQFRLLAERSAVGWQTYRDAAGADPDVAADWQQLMEIRRVSFSTMFAHIPVVALRPGLTKKLAADTAWAIASPQTHEAMVTQGGYSYDAYEKWVRTTLIAALLR
jgi:AcrR family transcriptional regulator